MHEEDKEQSVSTDADSPTSVHVETRKNVGRRTRHPGKKGGFVYFVRCCNPDGFIKLGYTQDVSSRVASLQCGCPYQLEVLASFWSDDAAGIEAALIERFKSSLVRCEWHRPNGDLLALIAGVVDACSRVTSVFRTQGDAGR